jgi:BirA family biotin operon repressor/biotin-[acetyl-CoA-carboxylase] ligase
MSFAVDAADVPAAAWGWLPLATGVALVDAVAPVLDVIGVEAGLKWPNDVQAGGGKLAGILAEVARPVSGPAIVVGVGLNVTQAPNEVGSPGATSLLDLGVSAPDRDQLVCSMLRELGGRVVQWRSADPGLAADYRAPSSPAARRSSGPRVTSMIRAGCAWKPMAKPLWFPPVTWCICARDC